MHFVRTFKGYEDKTRELDAMVNEWIAAHRVQVIDIKTKLSHEPGARSGSGDLLYTVIYAADHPVAEPA